MDGYGKEAAALAGPSTLDVSGFFEALAKAPANLKCVCNLADTVRSWHCWVFARLQLAVLQTPFYMWSDCAVAAVSTPSLRSQFS